LVAQGAALHGLFAGQVGGIELEAQVFGVQIRHFFDPELALEVRPNGAVRVHNQVARAGSDAGQKIQLALLKGQELGLAVGQKAHGHGIQIRQWAALPVAPPIRRVALKQQHVALVPELEPKRSRAHRVLAKVLAVPSHGLVRHHVGVVHGEDAQKRDKRLLEVNAQRGIVGRHETGVAGRAIGLLQHLAPEYPAARAGRGRVQDAFEGIHEVGGRDHPAFATGKNLAVVEAHPFS